ncbi:hypothetical protein OHS33_35560 [Streptomyces sp. NBC_00536]|uniref:hypothetical protein n=1 Tax=Streptomyces sp. NBC_00536 TaxID=2975769 RepID=UPI002E8176A4|nr:hypothetical protein [Streptomyces sp. NBC_00536]WUC83223.1 hypothetical protein OHS33_35560 [Streptomyces sp. NBC_00536]
MCWASHGALLVDKNGIASCPELENRTAYRISYPAMACEGTAVFWRDGKLLAVDTDLAGHEVLAMDDSRAVMSRALLLSEGSVVISLDSEVPVFRTPLGSLAEGPWACGDANLRPRLRSG